jgi:hypothetical protein
VYEVSPSGKESILYDFKGGEDGYEPVAGLIVVKGTLYGTTGSGGNCIEYGSQGCGTDL